MSLPIRRYLEVQSVETVGRDQPPWAMDKLLGVLARLWHPATLRFVVSAGGGEPLRAGWEVSGSDSQDVEAAIEDLLATSGAVAPWLHLVDTGAVRPWPAPGPVAAELLPGPPAPTALVAGKALAWQVAGRSADHWILSLELVALPGPESSALDVETPVGTGTGWSGREVHCRIRLHGSGPQRGLITALLAEDSAGPVSLAVGPAHSKHDRPVQLPVATVAHLLATPCRAEGAFKTRPGKDADELLSLVLGSASPHLLAIGSSGQGKSTFLRGLALAGLRRGAVPVAVDVEDGLTSAVLVRACREAGLDPLVIDFRGANPSRVDLTTPPPGVPPRRWADDLWSMLRQVLWAGMPDEYFGPVAERLIRVLLLLIILDPAGPRPLTDIPALLDPEDSRLRDQVLARIGDAELERAVRAEIVPLLSSRDPGNTSAFLLSKLEPLIGSAVIRDATAPRPGTVEVEQAVRAGRPVLIHAPTAVLGEAGSRVLVAVLMHRFWLAVQQRQAGPIYELFLDEFHLYASATMTDVLARGRKRGVRLRLAHQHLSQLPRSVLDAVLGNTGTLCCFRTGPADAALIESRFTTVSARQLQSLASHHLAVATDDVDGVYLCPPPSDEQRAEEELL